MEYADTFIIAEYIIEHVYSQLSDNIFSKSIEKKIIPYITECILKSTSEIVNITFLNHDPMTSSTNSPSFAEDEPVFCFLTISVTS